MEKQAAFNLNYERERVYRLFNQKPIFILGLIINIFVYYYISKSYVKSEHLIIWLGASILILIPRILFVKKTISKIKTYKQISQIQQAEKHYALGSFISAIIWGIGTSLLLPEGEIVHHVFTGFVIAGLSAAISVGYAVSKLTFNLFLWPAYLPYAVALTLQGTELHYSMATIFSLYTFFLITTFKAAETYSKESLNYNLSLSHDLDTLAKEQSDVAYKARMATLGELSANIAHEINSPLAILKTGLQIMEQKINKNNVDPELFKKMCSRLNNTTDRIGETVEALRAFSKDNKDIKYEEASLNEIITQTLSLATGKFKNGNVELRIKMPEINIRLQCYPVQIRQVIINLLNNSYDAIVEYKQRKKWVEIAATETAEHIYITVTDCGKGIPKEIQKNIFIPFYTTKSGYSGTGLGLAMVAGIIKKHQGSIKVNDKSANTQFVIELPKKITLDEPLEQAS